MPELLPEKLKLLLVSLCGRHVGALAHASQISFSYASEHERQSVGLLMPPEKLVYTSNALFPVMDQNIPEGYLFQRIREAYPKQQLTLMHLLALMGDNGIGRLGFALPGANAPQRARSISRETLLNTRLSGDVFDQMVDAYLSTGIGIAGMQPKIMVPDRATIPVPNVIIKIGSESYPGLAANEFVCLSAAKAAGISVPTFDLSVDGQMLLIDRFDLTENGAGTQSRLGFEDIASLMGLRVRDTLSDRKYQGSYQAIADVLKLLGLSTPDLQKFYEQVAFSVMVRNGDGHLKNYGVLYNDVSDIHLAPMYDVVTTAIYKYARLNGGEDLEDKTLALRLFAKNKTKAYPVTSELLAFGRDVCGVGTPARVLERIAAGMTKALAEARLDDRIPKDTLQAMGTLWQEGLLYASEAASMERRPPSRHA